MIDIRFFHPVEKLAGIGAEALDIPALTFCIKGINDQGRFSGAGEACDSNKLILGYGDMDIFKVIAPGANDLYLSGFECIRCGLRGCLGGLDRHIDQVLAQFLLLILRYQK
jgi:hypothetical protein